MLTTRTLSATVGGNRYPIIIGQSLESDLFKEARKFEGYKIVVIADSKVGKLWGDHVLSALHFLSKEKVLITFPGGEERKTMQTSLKLLDDLEKLQLGRDTLIIALGGGVVGDVVGFVASIFLRGVPLIQVPTTLLAMVDSSVGGKVGVDTKLGKNRIGQFKQPSAVIADLQFLETLPKKHLVNGLFEVIKMSITSDGRSLKLVKKLDLDDPFSKPKLLQDVVFRAVRYKAGVVRRDETEKNERKVLNFGHTIGHAIELLSGYRKLHGYCVALGVLAEIRIAERLRVLSSKDADTIEEYLAGFDIKRSEFKKFSVPDVIAATRTDKKVRVGQPHYVILESIGSVHVKDGQYVLPVPDSIVRATLNNLSA